MNNEHSKRMKNKRHKDYWSDIFTIWGWVFVILMYVITNTAEMWEPIKSFIE